MSHLQRLHDKIVSIYEKRSTLEREHIEKYLSRETWLNPKDALAHGFIDEIMGEEY